VLCVPVSAWAYRPFVSTDAAVADAKDGEIELGYFCIGGLSGGQESWVGQILGRGAEFREGMFRQQGLYAAYAPAARASD